MKTLAVIEDILKPTQEQMRGVSTLDLARLRGVIECDLYRMNVPIARIHHATMNAFARAGRSRKSDILTAARDNLPVDIQCVNDNEADAFWLLAMAMHRYAPSPIVQRTPRRITFGDKPDWPYWSWPEGEPVTVIAIDPSLSSTGVCVWRTGRPLLLFTIREQRWESYFGWDAPERHNRISNAITEYVKGDQ